MRIQVGQAESVTNYQKCNWSGYKITLNRQLALITTYPRLYLIKSSPLKSPIWYVCILDKFWCDIDYMSWVSRGKCLVISCNHIMQVVDSHHLCSNHRICRFIYPDLLYSRKEIKRIIVWRRALGAFPSSQSVGLGTLVLQN